MAPAFGQHPRSAAAPLAVLWLVLIVYASLFPFSDWRWPPGAGLADLMQLRWPRWWDEFDVVANLLGYLPLGALLTLAPARAGRRVAVAAGLAVAASAALSYGMEVTQQLLPQRVPSLADWLLNALGAALGALLAAVLLALGWAQRWQRTHDQWLERGGTGAVVLLMLWPLALLVPTPVPLGLGQIGGWLRELGLALLADVPWAEDAVAWLQAPRIAPSPAAVPEGIITALGLLSPCLVAYAASRPSWRRVWLALGAPLLALAMTTLSTALNFGPGHALAWRTPGALTAMIVGSAVALSLAWVGPRLAGGLGLVVLTGLALFVHQAPSDPYYAQNLQAWEQGRFIRFHGVLRWLGWLWPYAAMLWLLAPSRVGSRREG